MSNLSLLVTRPNHDRPTNYLCHWSQLVIDLAKQKNFSVYDLKGKKANKKTFSSYVKKNNPQIIFFNGHGDVDKITGINDEVLIEVDKNDHLLKGRIIYARSCRSAQILGVNCVKKKKAVAFIGYKNDFILFNDEEKITKPLSDRIASYFLEPSNLVITTIIKGNSPEEAYDRSQKESIRKIKFLLSPKAPAEEKSLITYMWRNMRAQVIIN
ncbi:hypothetical protein KKE34_05555 [Patescibacteria group bacterium]|nr:hypothetical protein [Patescibacteria group bacterium]MBU1886037.1 hypothetical protein [Patescibacteria group bacterium]